MTNTIANGDFVELQFTGRTDNNIFDSNDPVELKNLGEKETSNPLWIIVGQRMLVHGLDAALEGKSIGAQYHIHLSAQQGFGLRQASLVKAIPLRLFHEKKVEPKPGMSLMLDQTLVSIRAVSGARVIADFNNPLAGKELDYTFTIIKKLTTVEDKTRTFFTWFFRGMPEFKVSDKVTVRGPKILSHLVEAFKSRFKQLVGVELEFEEAQMAEAEPHLAKVKNSGN